MAKVIVFDNGRQQAISIDTLREVVRHLIAGSEVEIRTYSEAHQRAVAAITGAKTEGVKC